MRNKRKSITIVKGLELFGELLFAALPRHLSMFLLAGTNLILLALKICSSGIKLSDASKKLGKKFATGASVVKVCRFWSAK